MKNWWNRIKRSIKRSGTLNTVLVVVAVFFVWFNCQMIKLYREYGSIPESYACAVVAATIGECGICGWIKTTKERKQERKWEKQDRKENEES